MKNIFLLTLIICFANNLSAQNKKLVGTWKLVYENYIDTLDQGRVEINKDPKGYYKGSKILSSKHIQIKKVYPGDDDAFKITIVEENDGLWLLSGADSKVKLNYNSKSKNYSFPQRWPGEKSFSFRQNDKSKNLIFMDRKSRNITEEFSKI